MQSPVTATDLPPLVAFFGVLKGGGSVGSSKNYSNIFEINAMKIVKVISLSFCLCFQTKFDNQVFQIFLKNADNFGCFNLGAGFAGFFFGLSNFGLLF